MTAFITKFEESGVPGLYGYDVVIYRYGERKFLHFKRLHDVREAFQDQERERHSVSLIITPNGKCFTDDEFLAILKAEGMVWP